MISLIPKYTKSSQQPPLTITPHIIPHTTPQIHRIPFSDNLPINPRCIDLRSCIAHKQQ